jgi:hypothetical protein
MSYMSSGDARAACEGHHAVVLEGDALRDYHKELCRVAESYDGTVLSFADRIVLDAVNDEIADIEAYYAAR